MPREPRGGHRASPAPATPMVSLQVAPRWPRTALVLLCCSVCPQCPACSNLHGKLVKSPATRHQHPYSGVPPQTCCTPSSLSMPARCRAIKTDTGASHSPSKEKRACVYLTRRIVLYTVCKIKATSLPRCFKLNQVIRQMTAPFHAGIVDNQPRAEPGDTFCRLLIKRS